MKKRPHKQTLKDILKRNMRCRTCDGTGEVPSGMCYCGDDVENHCWANHSAIEIYERCEDCQGTGRRPDGRGGDEEEVR